MTNKELYNGLNEETRKYLDGIFSILDFLKENDTTLDKDLSMSEYASFLSILKFDNITEDFFNKYNINSSKYEEIYNKVELKYASECNSFIGFQLEKFLTLLINRIKEGYYLSNEEVNFSDVLPYQLFEYILNNSNKLQDYIKSSYNITSNINYELNKYLYNYYCEFAKKYKVDINEEINKEIDKLYPKITKKLRTIKENDYHRNYTPNLDKYGIDLTKEEYITDPCLGRDVELRRIEQILLVPRKDKSIIIVGETGVGKTALVEGLAYRVQKGDVPDRLKNLRIIAINAGDFVAGTEYSGTLEERMNDIFHEAKQSKDIIVFIDEIHQAIGAGKTQGNDNSVAELLKKPLKTARIIGATTNDEYVEYIESNTAFKSRLKKISIKEPDKETIFIILDNLVNTYNKMSEDGECSRLDLDDETKKLVFDILIDATNQTHTVHGDKEYNPRLVIDILDEAFSIAAINDRDDVLITDLAEALSLEERLNPSSRNDFAKKLNEVYEQTINNGLKDKKIILIKNKIREF